MHSSKKPGILFISHRSDLSGAVKCLQVLLQKLDRNRFRAEAAVPGPGPFLELLPEDVRIHVLSRQGFEHIGLKTLKKYGPRQLWQCFRVYLGYIKKLFGIIKRPDIDLVHVNTGVEPFAVLAARLAGKPCVLHIHETFPDHTWARGLSLFLMALVQKIVFVSHTTREAFIRLSGDAYGKSLVIYNGVDAASFVPGSARAPVREQWGASPETAVLVQVGSIAAHKGQLIFLQALALLRQQIHQDTFLGVFVGQGADSSYGQKVTSAAREKSIASVVRFLGFRRDVADILNAADILVVPSLDDSFPWVALEAMTLAKPVIASDLGGIREIVLPGQTGLLVPPGDPGQLAQALAFLIHAPETREKMGAQGRERVGKKFTEAQYLGEFEHLYASLLTGS
jgi:glycosyltransferase involved in cell wall biosynthesis